MRTIVVGTAGHIDHGKSALVKALTGTDPDRLKEEKARGITIELGFAHAAMADDVMASFVDVPGHERFVRAMLAGVGGGIFRDLDEAVDRMTVLEPTAYRPDRATTAAYADAYGRYRALFDAMEPSFRA